MNLRKLVWHEIVYRKGSFFLAVAGAAIAVAVVVGAFTLLRAHNIRTDQIIAEKELTTRQQMIALEEDYRLIMRDLGHNVLILHQEQDVDQMRSLGYPTKSFPEEYANVLGRSQIQTLNHLLPVLQSEVFWPEQNQSVIAVGIRGQVPVSHRTRFLTPDGLAYLDPITPPVAHGTAKLGWQVAQEAGLTQGEVFALQGETLTVAEVQPHQGNDEDYRIWVHLDQLQAWLGQEGQINGILALECVCHPDDLGLITMEVQRVLPNMQVLEFSSLVLVRHQVRARAERLHDEAIAAERAHRTAMRRERELFAAIFVPAIFLASLIWIISLTLANVRQRRSEIGILRAIGLSELQIMIAFLSKAALIGLLGAVVGISVGFIVGIVWSDLSRPASLFQPQFFLLVALLAPVVTTIASWIPAMIAAGTDPAVILRQD